MPPQGGAIPLTMLPPMPTCPNPVIELRPEQLGRAIAATGTHDFIRRLSEFLIELVPIDAVTVDVLRTPAGEAAADALPVWLGSAGNAPQDHLDAVIAKYYSVYYRRDPINDAAPCGAGIHVVQRSAGSIRDEEFRRNVFDVADIHDESVLSRQHNGVRFSVSLTRSRRLPPFSIAELARVRRIGELIFPLLDMHLRTAPTALAAASAPCASLVMTLGLRLAREHVRLSRRELETCQMLISGRTIVDVAQAFELSPTTVKCYLERVYAKLGIRSVRELRAWACKDAG